MVIEFGAWGWPQWTVLGMIAFTLMTHCVKHGSSRGEYTAWVGVADFVLIFALLYAGGFWAEPLDRELSHCLALLDPNVSAVPID